ncbi:MAG: lipoprotein [Rubrivivax sp.]|jgi:predicted small lipoprotein YifL|nr:lipoprotein [Rubrivivax sp.]
MQGKAPTSVATRPATLLVPMLIALPLLAGCGQKGPLVLPAPVPAASAGAR